MTDHLEPFRRMAQSIQSLPPSSPTYPSQHSVIPASEVSASSNTTRTEAEVSSDWGLPVDPSEHIAALIQEAVRKPTVLPDTYTILEDIGDRISRLTPPKPVEVNITPPKIPQPVPRETFTPVLPNQGQTIDPSERIAALVQEAVSKPTVLPDTYTILENIGDRINQLATPKAVDLALIEPKFPQPVSSTLSADLPATDSIVEDIGDRTSQLTTSEPVDSDIISPESLQPASNDTSVHTSEPQSMEVDPKKSLDDASPEASALAIVGAEAPTDQTRQDNSNGVVEPLEVAETTENSTPTAVVVEPVIVEETVNDKDTTAVVAQSAEVEETPNNQPITVVAPAPEIQQASFLVETQKVKATESDTVSSNSISDSAKPQNKKKSKAKGFGDSKKAK